MAGDVQTLVNRMTYWCAVANLGYNQAARWDIRPGGSCDCSSLVIHALKEAGFDTGTATYTGNLSANLTARGWRRLPADGHPQAGDILLNDVHHVAVYVGGGRLAQASIDERGRTSGGRPGDQTGHETNISSYYNFPWNCYLRYPPASSPAPSGKLAVDGLAGRATISRWQQVMGTPVDGVVSGQVIPDGRTYGRPNLLCVTYGGQGSTLIRAVQRVVGAVPDGLYGPDSIRRTQIRLGVDPDCWFGPATARALQERLNQCRF